MKIFEINHVAIHVKDVEKSLEFYTQVLGLPEIPRPAFDFPGAWLGIGNQQLHLIGGKEGIIDSHSRGNHFALQVTSIKEVEKLFLEKDIEFVGPKNRPDGAFQIFLQDPDGYFIELTQLIYNV